MKVSDEQKKLFMEWQAQCTKTAREIHQMDPDHPNIYMFQGILMVGAVIMQLVVFKDDFDKAIEHARTFLALLEKAGSVMKPFDPSMLN